MTANDHTPAAGKTFRVTIDERQGDGGWDTVSINVVPEAEAEALAVLMNGIPGALSQGTVTPAEVTETVLGWLGLDFDAYCEMPQAERLALLCTIGGGELRCPTDRLV